MVGKVPTRTPYGGVECGSSVEDSSPRSPEGYGSFRFNVLGSPHVSFRVGYGTECDDVDSL